MTVFLWATAAALFSAMLVRLTIAYAFRRGVLDIPNERSSHTRPTPRGGGIGMMLGVVAYLALAPSVGHLPASAWVGAAAIAAVAWLGWVDDHRPLGAIPRLCIHGAAGVAVAWMSREATVSLPGFEFAPALAASWWVFWTVSTINVVNFADGSDGLIGLQATVYATFAALSLAPHPPAVLAAIVLGSALGFLYFNWAPAKVFMGDVGSGGLGITFVVLGMYTVEVRAWSVVHAFLPLAPIFVDEVLTMGRRISRGESLLQAHRTHVYQRLLQAGWRTASVALFYGGLSVICAAVAFGWPTGSSTFWLAVTLLLGGITCLLWVLRSDAERRLA